MEPSTRRSVPGPYFLTTRRGPHSDDFDDRNERITIIDKISGDLRYGGLTRRTCAIEPAYLDAVSEAKGEPADIHFFVFARGRGINFVEHGKRLPEFVEGNANDKDPGRKSEVKEKTHAVHRMPYRNRSFPASKSEN